MNGISLNKVLHDDISQLMKEHTKEVHYRYEEGIFQCLFWDQQNMANSLGSCKSMHWHPLIIKWCLYLRHLSGNKAYELLRDSGCIKLPSQRTLRDDTHYIKRQVANSSVDPHKYVTMVMDEIYIKSDLVYEKHEGTLVEFVNIGDTKNQILEFEAIISNGESSPFSQKMMVFMVKGLLHKFDYPYVQLAYGKTEGSLIFDSMWEAIARLERIGFCLSIML